MPVDEGSGPGKQRQTGQVMKARVGRTGDFETRRVGRWIEATAQTHGRQIDVLVSGSLHTPSEMLRLTR